MRKLSIFFLLFVMAVAGAFYVGKEYGSESSESVVSEGPRTLEEIREMESTMNQQQLATTAHLAEVRNQIETTILNLNLGEDITIKSAEIEEKLNELNEDLLGMKTQDTASSVPLPPDSPAGKLERQPRTASGIPVSVLENYEQQTGVAPSEIEELMHRTE